MKISANRADAFAKKPDPAARLLLVYGNDRGLVRERADAATAAVVDDLSDPFRVVSLTAAQISDDPARLGDEAAAITFGGGQRVVRINGAGDSLTKVLKGFLDDPLGDALVVVEADMLNSRSSLRKLAEGAKNAAALPCFADEGQSLDRVIEEVLAAQGWSVTAEAKAFLAENLGGDRLLTRRELEKLAIYLATPDRDPKAPVSLEEAAACVGDTSALSLDDLAYAVGDGQRAQADRALVRLFGEGMNAIAVLRALGRHFTRLQFVAAALAQGKPADTVCRSLQPPVFGPRANRLAAQANRWPAAAVSQAIARIDDAEAQCKTTSAPDELLCARLILSLSAAAKARR